MTKRNIVVLFCIFFIFAKNCFSIENKILIKVDNEIITYLDVVNEINYLKALNPQIKNLDKDKLFEISKKSIIREKVKKIEILKRVKDLNIDNKYLDQLIKRTYLRLNIKTKKDFKIYLEKFNVDLNTVNKKISTIYEI